MHRKDFTFCSFWLTYIPKILYICHTTHTIQINTDIWTQTDTHGPHTVPFSHFALCVSYMPKIKKLYLDHHRQTHAQEHKHMYIHVERHQHTQIKIHTDTCTLTYRSTHADIHRHIHIYLHTQTHIQLHIYTQM